eukprot:TRINITY_DN61474_c0_g1_i1.p2 TRINITY_DN61474_c0_g1~~TRINITY_DN61474_c0_g1_i1.p2  ORF type:complete len:197 (+),score=31.96 TRINITY_DN61474_c0_g1_i1:60-650(+)
MATFPPPPAFYKEYLEGAENGPPPPPYHVLPTTNQSYESFNRLMTQNMTNIPLDEASEGTFKQLYPVEKPEGPQVDFKHWLKTFLQELVKNYLQLLEVLANQTPDTTEDATTQSEELVKKMEELFANTSHLLQSYRPHLARQHLIKLMKEQIQNRTEAMELVAKQSEQVRSLLKETGAEMVEKLQENRYLLDTLSK